ncbi:MAG: hypothetical protein VYB33_01635, partial [Pseudomonadota bacterium]|nr:hypothetical protein [Pseudomonadota bacterium]
MDVEVVLNAIIRDFGRVCRDKILKGVMMNVADCDLSRVDAHLSGVDVDLPGIYLWPAVVVGHIRDALGRRGRRCYLVEVLHDLLDRRDGLAYPGHSLLGDPIRALDLCPRQ